MTEPVTLPGLPEPRQDGEPLTNLEVCTLNLQAAIAEICGAAIAENPGLNPADAAGNVGSIVGKSLLALMPPGAARLGLLVAFEQTHDNAMTFIDINHAKAALEKLADRRRRTDKTSAGGVILPGKD